MTTDEIRVLSDVSKYDQKTRDALAAAIEIAYEAARKGVLPNEAVGLSDEDALYQAMIENGNDYNSSDHYRQECMIPDPIECKPEAKQAGHYVTRCLECGWIGCTANAIPVNEDDPMWETFSYRCPTCDSGELEECED